ncbi:MMPL family transporter [Streptomyces erythrochromogenes]|uniref:MMPL family transporter n=1 Tax=Streptomyces erythrochromogenes TaxID=285574 RepID=UPI0022558F62|nr:MMPL family transporter [Streptomyces erythrochromogenes]MCX5586288.1 MMPL family transporter [Streptomyces erythrochromogenes]
MLRLLGAHVVRRPWLFLVAALVLVLDALLLGADLPDRLGNGGTTDPASESARVQRVLEAHYPEQQPNLVLLVSVPQGGQVDDRALAAQGAGLAERLAFEKPVVGVVSYWQTGLAELRSHDGRQAVIAARIVGDEDRARAALEELAPRYRGGQGELTVRITGPLAVRDEIQSTVAEDLARSELIALPLTLIVLVWVFGGVPAAALPVLVGLVTVLATGAVLRIITGFTEVSVFAQNLTTALGLGLAIDYALLIVRRFREELDAGAAPGDAVARTVRTAGRTVLFSALTVAVALAAMLVFPLYFLRSLAYAGITVVLVSALAALTVLPAALALLGRRVDALTVRRRRRLRRGPAEGAVPGARVTRLVMRRAPLVTAAVTGVLLVLGLPFLDARFGTADHRQLPASSQSRAAQESLRTDFDDLPEGSVPVLLRDGGAAPSEAQERTARIAGKLSALAGVTRVESSAGTYRDGRLTEVPSPADSGRRTAGYDLLTVVAEDDTAATSAAHQDLVRALRTAAGSDGASVGGPAAEVVDSKAAIGGGLIPALALILLGTLVLVFLLTGSAVLPLLTVLLNGLSLTAMFGAVVWVFQEGALSGPLGFTATGDIEATLPVLMFCVAFGLSMDYGVFLVARIKEHHDRGGDHRAAVLAGMRSTGGLITAAAVVLSVVFVSIGLSRITNTKMLGLGVALAVLVDALVVRTLLVPAVLALLGPRTWWAPAPLRRVHRRLGLREGTDPEPQPSAPDSPAGPERTSHDREPAAL